MNAQIFLGIAFCSKYFSWNWEVIHRRFGFGSFFQLYCGQLFLLIYFRNCANLLTSSTKICVCAIEWNLNICWCVYHSRSLLLISFCTIHAFSNSIFLAVIVRHFVLSFRRVRMWTCWLFLLLLLVLNMWLTWRRIELLLLICLFMNILSRRMQTRSILSIFAWIYYLTAAKVVLLNITTILFLWRVMTVLLLNRILWCPSRSKVVPMTVNWWVSFRGWVRLNCTWRMLTILVLEATVIRMSGKFVFVLSTIYLLISYFLQLVLELLVVVAELCLIVHLDSWWSIFRRGTSSLIGCSCSVFLWVTIPTIPLHELLTGSVLWNRLSKLTHLYLVFRLVHSVRVGTTKILRLRRWVAANMSHMTRLMRCILVRLMEIWPWLKINSTLCLIYIFLRTLTYLFLSTHTSRWLFCRIQNWKTWLLSIWLGLIWKHQRMTSHILGWVHASSRGDWLVVVGIIFENAPHHILAWRNSTPWRY